MKEKIRMKGRICCEKDGQITIDLLDEDDWVAYDIKEGTEVILEGDFEVYD